MPEELAGVTSALKSRLSRIEKALRSTRRQNDALWKKMIAASMQEARRRVD